MCIKHLDRLKTGQENRIEPGQMDSWLGPLIKPKKLGLNSNQELNCHGKTHKPL